MPRSSLEGTRVLVTGGAGFIGSHLVEALVGESEVRVLDDFSTGRRVRVPDDVRVFEGDVRDDALLEDAMAGVDVVFHLAARTDVEQSVEAPVETHAVNVGGTLSVLEAARAVDARVVFASSAAVYGHPECVPIGEDDRKRPTNPYGLSKRTGEEYCRIYSELYGVDTVTLRYFNVYGPRQSGGQYNGVISVFLAQASACDPITVHGDGAQTRDFVHVSDVVRANQVAAVCEEGIGEAFNVGTGASVSVLELAELVRELTGSDSEIVHVEEREADIERSRANVSKMTEGRRFEADVTLRAGLADLIEGASSGCQF